MRGAIRGRIARYQTNQVAVIERIRGGSIQIQLRNAKRTQTVQFGGLGNTG